MRDCQDLHLLYWFFFVFVSLCLAASPCRLLCRIVPPSSCVFKWPSFSLLGYIFQGSSVSDVLCSWVPPSVLQVLIISVFGSPLLLKPIASIGFTCPSCWASCVFSSVHSSHSLHHSWCFWYFTLLSSISSLFAHITDEVIFTSHNYHFYQHFLTYAPPQLTQDSELRHAILTNGNSALFPSSFTPEYPCDVKITAPVEWSTFACCQR